MTMPENPDVPAGRFTLVGTPIGNLGDISKRTAAALVACDIVVAEDTRRIRVLLSHLGIEGKQVMSVDANTERNSAPHIVELVRSGKDVVYCSDAGMPGISDPGTVLVREVAFAGLQVDVVPGPSAVILAASLSGLCESGFVFSGFLPVKPGARKKELLNLKESEFPSIVFESPNRIGDLLNNAAEIFGPDHDVFIGRELTKFHQELFHGTISHASEHFGSQKNRGEFAVVFGRSSSSEKITDSTRLLEQLIEGLNGKSHKTKQIAEEIAQLIGLSKNKVYDILVEAKTNKG